MRSRGQSCNRRGWGSVLQRRGAGAIAEVGSEDAGCGKRRWHDPAWKEGSAHAGEGENTPWPHRNRKMHLQSPQNMFN